MTTQDDLSKRFPAQPGIALSDLPFPIVGIGASAGGVSALVRFFENMPESTGIAFVVVLHLSPKHESNIAQILQGPARMPVQQVNDTVRIQADNVYIIPPNKHLLMNDGCLRLVPPERPPGPHVAIDLFLRTLAETHRERAISIILTGAGSDGALGMTRIKGEGGITIAQDPDDAEYDSMPRSAIETGMVDLVLPVADMPQKLVELRRISAAIRLPTSNDHAFNAALPLVNAKVQAAEAALKDIMATLRARTGHDFLHYKRATVLRRIERRLQVNALPDIGMYRDYLEQNQKETPLLLQDMLIGVTNFFRDREAFEALERDILPKIFKSASNTEQVRAWSVACSTGEEAYSLAILMAEQAAVSDKQLDLHVFATDIDEQAIDIARQGTYLESIVTDVAPARLRQYFTHETGRFRIHKDIREKVLFASHNILRDPPFSKLDLISCRNLLIYLDRDIQSKIFEMFHFALRPGGYLFLGSSESADAASEFFIPVDKKNRIYRASTVARRHYVAPQPFRGQDRMLSAKSVADIAGRKKLPMEELHQRLMEQYSPPSVIVDQNHDIVYLSGQVSRFLQYPSGRPTHNLITAVHADLKLDLRAALFQVSQSRSPAETRRVTMNQGTNDDARSTVRIIVRPILAEDASNLMLVLFDEEEALPDTGPSAANSSTGPAIAQLESELKRTQEQLQSIIEQYEESSEDLKASNEELQSINEELRSATEELETSKEELQSINEELITVNFELKTKVDETSKANDDLQNFVSATDIATVFVDRGLRIKRFTPPVVAIFNMIASDVGRPLRDITHRLDYAEMADDVELAFETLQLIEREVHGSNGRWYIVRLLPYRTAEDRIEGLVLTFIDITTRKQAQENLRLGEERMHLVAASTKDYAIITMDMAGLITSWNTGAEKMFGYGEREVMGHSAELIFVPEDMESHAFEQEIQHANQFGRAEDERWHLRKNGSRLYCSGILSPLVDDTIQGYVKIARDVTGDKHAAVRQHALLEQEKQIRQQAEEAARTRDEFFAVLSHELKQPLNLIALSAETLARLPETRELPGVTRIALTLKQTVAGQAKIIDDLLDLSRLHTGKLTLERSTVDMAQTVSHMVQLIGSDAGKKHIKLQLNLSGRPVLIDADPVRAEQIVWNLLSNAVKFTPEGGRVELTLMEQQGFARLEVADTGKGIPSEFLPFVFDMFRQADSGSTRQHEGMGIGLALVKELVHSHGGSIEVESPGEDQGSRFRVFMPLANAQALPPVQPVSIEDAAVLAGKRILLVEDSTDILEALGALLRGEGAIVTLASSGEAAIACQGQFGAFRSHHFRHWHAVDGRPQPAGRTARTGCNPESPGAGAVWVYAAQGYRQVDEGRFCCAPEKNR